MAEMGDSPKQTNPMATPQPANAGSTPPDKGLVFNSSEIGTKTAQKQDVFAEHKRKAAEQKAKNKLTRKRILILGGIGVALIVGIVVLIVWVSKPVPVDELSPTEQLEVVDQNSEFSEELFNKATETAENGGSVQEVFDEAINASRRPGEASLARVTQMRYVSNNSGDSEYVIELGKEETSDGVGICEDQNLGLLARALCHNLLSNAYYELMQHDKADYHMERARSLTAAYFKLTEEDNK